MDKVVIDLTSETLDESWLRMFGNGITAIINAMFGGNKIPITVKGSKSDVKSFAKVLGGEKKYMQAYQKYGLDNPKTYRSKFKLNKSIRDFERKTGLTYPLK